MEIGQTFYTLTLDNAIDSMTYCPWTFIVMQVIAPIAGFISKGDDNLEASLLYNREAKCLIRTGVIIIFEIWPPKAKAGNID